MIYIHWFWPTPPKNLNCGPISRAKSIPFRTWAFYIPRFVLARRLSKCVWRTLGMCAAACKNCQEEFWHACSTAGPA